MNTTNEIRFDGWTLHRPTGELHNAGTRVRLRPQPLAVLEALLAQPGELVTREQLIARLWPRRIVDFDTGLNTAVRRLRAVLRDDADAPRYIETIPRRGYRFIGRLEVGGGEVAASNALRLPAAATAPRTRWAWPVAASVLLVAISFAAAQRPDPGSPAVAKVAASASPNAQARERYERARFLFNRRSPGDVERSLQYFLESVEIEPRFARGWAGLAGAYWINSLEGRLPMEQGLVKMRVAAERALALDPGLAAPHLRLAAYHQYYGETRRADLHRRLATELDPDDPMVLAFAAGKAASDDRYDEAIELQRRAVESEPLSLASRGTLVAWLVMAGHLDEAESQLRRILELNPDHGAIALELAQVLILQGRPQEALEVAHGLQGEADRSLVLVLANHALGRDAEADAALRNLIETAPADDPVRIAEAHAYLGRTDEAFRWLASVPANSCDQPRLRYSALLKPLHPDPRWSAALDSGRRRS